MTVAVLHPLTDAETVTICRALAARQLPVAVETDVYNTVHLWPSRKTTAAEEVTALRAFIAVTDAPIAWHERTTA